MVSYALTIPTMEGSLQYPPNPPAGAFLQMTKHPNSLSREDIKFMLRYTANAVRQNHHDLLPLLQWLEKEYAMSRQSDPAAYAHQLLESLNSE